MISGGKIFLKNPDLIKFNFTACNKNRMEIIMFAEEKKMSPLVAINTSLTAESFALRPQQSTHPPAPPSQH